MGLVGRLTAVARTRSPHARAAALAMAGLVALVGTGCTGARPTLATKPDVSSTASTTTRKAAAPAEVAEAKGDAIDVFLDARSEALAERITAADATAAPNIPIVFLVKSRAEDRVEVYLPGPPSGSSGWVRADDVQISTDPYRIEVSLAAHRIRVFELDRVILDEPVSVGRIDRPTPGGAYYVKELLQPPDPTGPYGTYAYGLSGFSTERTSFSVGEGVVGIHGTSDPSSIGADVSTGCIGLRNDVIKRLVTDIGIPLGTPVEILE